VDIWRLLFGTPDPYWEQIHLEELSEELPYRGLIHATFHEYCHFVMYKMWGGDNPSGWDPKTVLEIGDHKLGKESNQGFALAEGLAAFMADAMMDSGGYSSAHVTLGEDEDWWARADNDPNDPYDGDRVEGCVGSTFYDIYDPIGGWLDIREPDDIINAPFRLIWLVLRNGGPFDSIHDFWNAWVDPTRGLLTLSEINQTYEGLYKAFLINHIWETTCPIATMTCPAADTWLNGEVHIAAWCYDPDGQVNRVEFRLSSPDMPEAVLSDYDGSDGWSVDWDSSGYSTTRFNLGVTAQGINDVWGYVSDPLLFGIDNEPPEVEATPWESNYCSVEEIRFYLHAKDFKSGLTSVRFCYMIVKASGEVRAEEFLRDSLQGIHESQHAVNLGQLASGTMILFGTVAVDTLGNSYYNGYSPGTGDPDASWYSNSIVVQQSPRLLIVEGTGAVRLHLTGPSGFELTPNQYYVMFMHVERFRLLKPEYGQYILLAAASLSRSEDYTLTARSYEKGSIEVDFHMWRGEAEVGSLDEYRVWLTDGMELVEDLGAPSTEAVLLGTPGNNGWYVSDVIVALRATDDASGVASTAYSLDGGVTWNQYAMPFTVSTEGTSSIQYYSVDNLGKTETTKSSSLWIDKTPPIISGAPVGPPDGLDGWYVTDVSVHFTASDGVSGLYSVTPDRILSTEGAGQHVLGEAVDMAGNSATFDVTGINIDKTPPVSDATLSGTVGLGGRFVSAVTATLESSDGISGVDEIRYCLDAGEWCLYVSPIDIGIIGDHRILFCAADAAGNTEDQRSVEFRIEQNLAFEPASASTTAINIDCTLIVNLTDDSGYPIENVEILFSCDPEGLMFGTMPAITDSSGLARTAARSGTPGVYLITASTSLGVWANWTLVAYDPASMAVGGGRYCPLGPDGTQLAGSVHFSLAARYVKQAPSISMRWQYRGNEKLDLEATSMEWLIVNGGEARVRGAGTLNGVPGYVFQIEVLDAADGDTFAIEIWDSEGVMVHGSHNVLQGGNVMVRTKGSISAVDDGHFLGARDLAVICLLLVLLSVGLRGMMNRARMMLVAPRHDEPSADASTKVAAPRTRKLRLPCPLAEVG